jgi:dTDP-4-dehydrorhamnose reductase
MKVLVCGSSGLVGNDLCNLLEKEGIEYIGIHNTRPRPKSHKIDILNSVELNTFLEKENPTVCINCIADRNVDLCEINWEQTKKVNTDIVNVLVNECSRRNIYFIHISTDYVFDGRLPPYSPSSQVNPLQIYGITKFLAECRVLNSQAIKCIVRVPVLYTNTYTNLADTAVTVLAKKVMNQIEHVKEDNYSIRRPVFIPDFCVFLLDCIREKRQGVYHFYNPDDRTTKYGMCTMIGAFLQKPTSHIEAINDPPSNDASRPYDTKFLDTQYDRNKFPITHIGGGIALCLEKYWHPPLFHNPHKENVFLLLDLDGTLIDTDNLHYYCYKIALREYNIELSWDEYRKFSVIEDRLRKLMPNETEFQSMKQRKRELIKQTKSIQFIPGAEDLLRELLSSNTQFAVVTNTGRETVEHFKSICPLLQQISNWVTREDYKEPKPNPECYRLALQKFYTNQKYIVGIENTLSGFQALKEVTSRVYVITEKTNPYYSLLKKEDCYLIPDLTCLNTRVA